MSKKAAHLQGLMQHEIAQKQAKVDSRPKIMMPFHVICSCLTFFVSLMPGHVCVLGYDNAGENDHAFHSIRGAKASMMEPNGNERDGSIIIKLAEVLIFCYLVCTLYCFVKHLKFSFSLNR